MTFSELLTRGIDLFHVGPLKRIVPLRTFRYGVCGGGNLVLNWALYFAVHNFVVAGRFTDVGFYVVSPHVMTLAAVFPITFFTGFWLQKHISFRYSPLRTRTQLFRYGVSVAGSLLLNYAGLKFLVEAMHVYPTPSQVITSLVTVVYSYFAQKYFTFRGCGGQ